MKNKNMDIMNVGMKTDFKIKGDISYESRRICG